MIPLARPVLGAEEERAVIEVLRSGQLSLGPRVLEFERRFAARLMRPDRDRRDDARLMPSNPDRRNDRQTGAGGAGRGGRALCASAVSSGTAGLHLALRAVGVKDGDEVITSPFSFVASANVALYERARPVFADIDPLTLNLDPAAAEAAITPRTRAILPVHIFGYPANMAAFEAIAHRHGLALVEDACEALGAVHGDGVPVGGRGHPAVFGFYANKQITTGEGGMVVVGDEATKACIDSERNQGRSPDMGWLDHDRLGFNYRLSDVACAIGLAQLERLEEMLAGRARVAGLYREALGGIEGLELPCEDGADTGSVGGGCTGARPGAGPTDAGSAGIDPGARRGWFVFVVQLPAGVDRDGVVRRLAELGVQSKPYLPAIHLMRLYRERFGHREGELPVCEGVAKRSLALPFWPGLSEGEIGRVGEGLREALGAHRSTLA